MQSKKIELGDIFTLRTNKGFACIQCVEIPDDTRNEIELIKVYYNLHLENLIDIENVIQGDFFFIRFPLKAAFRRKIVQKIGTSNLPSDFRAPMFFRTENIFGEGWNIVNSKTLFRETVFKLSEDQKKLSPWGIMNDTKIIELLENNWKLEIWE